ncbi:unnamed protein product, partial [Ilex paraguariensis]
YYGVDTKSNELNGHRTEYAKLIISGNCDVTQHIGYCMYVLEDHDVYSHFRLRRSSTPLEV